MDLRMDLMPEDREDAWLLLAELFFLDTEHSDQVFQTAAESLKRMGLGREDAENILTYEVAPVAGVNLWIFALARFRIAAMFTGPIEIRLLTRFGNSQ